MIEDLLDGDELVLWRSWLRDQGVDPRHVAVPGWIERRPGLRQLVCLSYDRTADGAIKVNDARTDAVRIERVIQLDRPPLPFPTAS